MPKDYSWITDAMFDAKLGQILDKQTGAELLAIPGLYEVVSDHFNNQVLGELEADKER